MAASILMDAGVIPARMGSWGNTSKDGQLVYLDGS